MDEHDVQVVATKPTLFMGRVNMVSMGRCTTHGTLVAFVCIGGRVIVFNIGPYGMLVELECES